MTSFTLTKLRSQILHILQRADKPMKAYDILEQLRKVRPNAQPPTAYRVLDFFKRNDVIHEITHQHTYVLCQATCKEEKHPPNLLLICKSCEQVAEAKANEVISSIMPITERQKFKPITSTIEVIGLCEDCQ